MKKPEVENPTAFPQEIREVHEKYQGMSLRDYFAGQALVGLSASWYKTILDLGVRDPDGMKKLKAEDAESIRNTLASGSYLVADAMLKERSK